MELSEVISEASAAFIAKQYQTACCKYKTVLKLLSIININISTYNNDQVLIKYMLCKSLIESDALQDILQALETLIELKKYIPDFFPAIYYVMGKAYIKLYRFNSALDAINAGLAIANTKINFQEFCIPMTSITIEESTKEGLLTALMNLHDEASSWHCPDAKCYMEQCQNYVPNCLPCRDIFFRDPAFKGLVIVTCSNTNNPCKFKFHPVCWDFQKEKLFSISKLPDKEIIGSWCFTLNCTSNNSTNIITKIEIFDNKQTIISTTQKSSLVTQSISTSPVFGAIKKYPPLSSTKLRRPNLPHRFSPQNRCSEEKPLKEEIEKEIRLAKLIKLREANFDTSNGKDLKLDNDRDENENLDSTSEILSDLIFKDHEVETMQQCCFIFEILHEFIKSNLMVHTNQVLLKWHETKGIIEYNKSIDEYLDSDIMELLLKSKKFINIGDYICIPETLEQALQIFEREIIEQCKFLLPLTHNENGDAQFAVNDMPRKKIVTNCENQTDQNPSRLLCLANNMNNNNNNICQNFNICETTTEFTKINSLNEGQTNTSNQTKNRFDWNIEGYVHTFSTENEDKLDFNHSYKDTSFINSNDMKKNNTNFASSMIHEDNSRNNIKSPSLKENTTKNSLDDNFIKQLPNDDRSSKFIILQEKYTELKSNYSEMEQTLIKLTKEKADLEQNFKLELEKKNSIMEAIIEERKILIKKLATYESHIAEEVPVKYEALNKGIVTLKTEINRLKQERLDNEHNMKLLLKEKHVAENTLEKSNTELFEALKHCHSKLDKKNTELITYQEKNLELKKCMLEKSLESQFFHSQNILYQGIKYCQVALEIFDILNYTTNHQFGLNIIPNYAIWIQALNYLQAEYKKMEENYSELKSLLQSKTEVEKMDKIVLKSVNLPPCPNSSLGTVIRDAFMLFYTHITKIPQQGFTFAPSTILMAPYIQPYIQHSIQPSNNSNLPKITKTNVPTNSIKSDTNLTQSQPKSKKKYMEDKYQNIPQKSDFGKENNEGIQDNLQHTNTNKEEQCNLTDNENDLDNKFKEYIKDNNKIIEEKKANEASPTNMNNSDISNACNKNKLVSESNDVSDNSDSKLLSEKKIEEALGEENIENTEKSNNNILINSIDKVMSLLRNKYTGMSDLLLLKSLNDLRTMHNGTLTGMPLKTIMQKIEKCVLSYQINHLCTYIETKEIVNNPATVLKESKKQSKSKVKKKSSSNLIKLKPLKKVAVTNSLLTDKTKEPKTTKPTLSGAIKKEPINLSKCPWDVIFKPGTNKNNYGESECIICMENLDEIGKPIYVLDCQHKFHKTCIKEWFQKNQSCPTCRIHCTIDEEYPPLP